MGRRRFRPVAQHGYGFFPGGDPRDFSPDDENPEEEKEAHRLACEAAATGAVDLPGSCRVYENAIITRSGFGTGIYTYWVQNPETDAWQPGAPRMVWPEGQSFRVDFIYPRRLPRKVKKRLATAGLMVARPEAS